MRLKTLLRLKRLSHLVVRNQSLPLESSETYQSARNQQSQRNSRNLRNQRKMKRSLTAYSELHQCPSRPRMEHLRNRKKKTARSKSLRRHPFSEMDCRLIRQRQRRTLQNRLHRFSLVLNQLRGPPRQLVNLRHKVTLSRRLGFSDQPLKLNQAPLHPQPLHYLEQE